MENANILHWDDEYVYNSILFLFIKQIAQVKRHPELENVFKYKNKCISKVEVLGHVLIHLEKNNFHILTIDDGTGLLDCQLDDICYQSAFGTENIKGKCVQAMGFLKPLDRSNIHLMVGKGDMPLYKLSVISIRLVDDMQDELIHIMQTINSQKQLFSYSIVD